MKESELNDDHQVGITISQGEMDLMKEMIDNTQKMLKIIASDIDNRIKQQELAIKKLQSNFKMHLDDRGAHKFGGIE